MAMPYIKCSPDPDKPHYFQFKPEKVDPNMEPKIFIEKPKCVICGATEETEICIRTVYG